MTSPALETHTDRFVGAQGVAEILGRSRAWFYAKKQALSQLGFPAPHPVVRLYDRQLVEKWIDAQSFLSDPEAEKNECDDAF